jgi:hypothetical protein
MPKPPKAVHAGERRGKAVVSSKLNEAATRRDCNCRRTVSGAQLLHNVLDVNFHRLLGYEELLRDVYLDWYNASTVVCRRKC